eukprot:6374407-Prymnesium_polylepis.2
MRIERNVRDSEDSTGVPDSTGMPEDCTGVRLRARRLASFSNEGPALSVAGAQSEGGSLLMTREML